MLIPKVENFHTLGTLFSSSLFPGRAPAGHVLLTSYVGGARNPDLALSDPDTLVRLVLEDLQKLLGGSLWPRFGPTSAPTFIHTFLHPLAIPQYNIGFQLFKGLMSRTEAACAGFYLAGHYRNGVSLGDSIVSGHDAAERIRAHLAQLAQGAAGPGLRQLQIKAAA